MTASNNYRIIEGYEGSLNRNAREKVMTDKKDKNQEAEINDEKLEKRRKALKSILAGSGTVVTAAAMQDKWAKPVIESVVLPAHAQTSGLAGSFTSSNNTQNGTDLLDSLVPSAHAACPFLLCINVSPVGIVDIQVIDGAPVVETGSGTLQEFEKGITLSNKMSITGVVSGKAPERVINGQYNGYCNTGSYPQADEAPGTCKLTGSTTTSTSGTTNTTRTTSTTRTGTTGTTSTTTPPS